MEKIKQLVIIGAGEFAEIAFEYFTHDSEYEVVAFAVHQEYLKESELCGKPIVSVENLIDDYPPNSNEVFVAIPASQLNRIRKKLYDEAKSMGYILATYISSKAFVWHNVIIGDNCFIFENNTVQPFVEIGDNVILWSGNHVGHRTKVNDNVFVSSHVVISGYCEIGEGCFLGVNSTLNDNTSIPNNSILASGSLINKKLKEEETIYIGNPAKPLPKKSAFDIKL